MRHCRSCSAQSKMIQDTLIAFSPRATRIWGGSITRERSFAVCGPLPLSSYSDGGMPRNPEHRELALSGLRLAAADAN